MQQLYNEKGTIKEFGKLIYDFAKIGLAVAVVSPLVKGEHFSALAFVGVVAAVSIGTYLIDMGGNDE